jgi:segregation and condensation protein B
MSDDQPDETADDETADGVESTPEDATALAEALPRAEPLIETFGVETLSDGQQRLVATGEPEVVPDTSDLPPGELRAVLESLLFVATRPMPIDRLCECLPGTSTGYLEGFLTGLAERYEHENRGWELRRLAGGWQLLTRRSLYPWVRQLERKELPTRLSKGALETLAIVAYKQPLTRGEVEDIRGVQCGPVLRQLMDLKLVQVLGRSEEALGRPLLYGTTDHFLSRFGLGAISDLPRKHEFGA